MNVSQDELGGPERFDNGAIYEIRGVSGEAGTSTQDTVSGDGLNRDQTRNTVLSAELQRESDKHVHLKKYLSALPILSLIHI